MRASHWRDCEAAENPCPHPEAVGRGGPHDYWFIDITDLNPGDGSLIPAKVRGSCKGEGYTGHCTVAKVGGRTIATYVVNLD